jgi:hypothetical protein
MRKTSFFLYMFSLLPPLLKRYYSHLSCVLLCLSYIQFFSVKKWQALIVSLAGKLELGSFNR